MTTARSAVLGHLSPTALWRCTAGIIAYLVACAVVANSRRSHQAAHHTAGRRAPAPWHPFDPQL